MRPPSSRSVETPLGGHIAAGVVRHFIVPLVMLAMILTGLHLSTAGAAPVSSANASVPSERLGESHDNVRVLLVSDSTWLSLGNYGAFDAVQGFPNEMALAQCRRRVAPSCSNPAGTPPTLLAELTARGSTPGWNTLVVQTGYNDSADSFIDDFGLIVATARQLGYTQIIWLTLRLPENNPVLSESYQSQNQLLVDLVGRGSYPDVEIADWGAYSAAETTWVGTDGIHYTPLGAWAAADYLSRKIAALNRWPCPYPVEAGRHRRPYCVDPDAMTTKPDLESLYPVTLPYSLPIYSWTGSSSWPASPWWSID